MYSMDNIWSLEFKLLAITCVTSGNSDYELKTMFPVLSSTSIQKNSYRKKKKAEKSRRHQTEV